MFFSTDIIGGARDKYQVWWNNVFVRTLIMILWTLVYISEIFEIFSLFGQFQWLLTHLILASTDSLLWFDSITNNAAIPMKVWSSNFAMIWHQHQTQYWDSWTLWQMSNSLLNAHTHCTIYRIPIWWWET